MMRKQVDIAEQVKQLKETHLSSYLSSQEIETMLSHCKIVSFLPKQIIFHQGKCVEGFYLIVKGNVNVYARTLGEGIKKIEVLGPGDFLGEISFIENDPSLTSAITEKQVKCLHITSIYFELLASYSPETKYKILRKISIQVCRRLKHIHDKAADFIAHTDMIALSLFGRVVHSFTHPKPLAHSIDYTPLRKKVLFQRFTEIEMDELFALMQPLEAPKNCILIHEGEKNPSCFIVIHGAVQSSIMQDNKMAKLSVIGPRTLFASIACVDDKSEFTITFMTCESALLLKISEEKLRFLQKNKPLLWFKLFNLICESIIALGKSINKLDIRLHIEMYNR
ncbi:cyclic nucleotide-binding domain-containing protein [Legionella israelensis]|uniref:Cyclic nucleotide-binding domain-containing protein n=1 Tax=Legionella israelensis TaxID=454 RepID=A0AAX1EFX0_9GAMM|nr:cyclic nucleotide-binding domain-containing protein [Legionella israelensis]QBR83895.1 cyclic nucleotide-binding domain-containing protein [Legionella israelensis]